MLLVEALGPNRVSSARAYASHRYASVRMSYFKLHVRSDVGGLGYAGATVTANFSHVCIVQTVE